MDIDITDPVNSTFLQQGAGMKEENCPANAGNNSPVTIPLLLWA